MRSADLRRRRARRPNADPPRPGVTALLRARGMPRRSARAVIDFVLVPSAGLADLARCSALPTTPRRREMQPRG